MFSIIDSREQLVYIYRRFNYVKFGCYLDKVRGRDPAIL
jgi:hypothetical protein